MQKIMIFLSFFISFVFTSSLFAEPLDNNVWDITDSLAFERIGAVAPSPDGKQVLFITMKIVETNEKKEWGKTLYLKKTNGDISILSKGTNNISMPRWAPDGKYISYLSSSDNLTQLVIQDLKNNKKIKLVELESEIHSYKWSNDGSMIAFVASIQNRLENGPLKLVDVGNEYTHSRIYIVSVDNMAKKAVKLDPVTPNTFSISIFEPYHGSGFDWSADNQSIVFAYRPKPGAMYDNLSKLAIVDLGTKEIKYLPYAEASTRNQPLYSPDNQWIAFRSNLPKSKTAVMLNNDLNLFSRICVLNTVTDKTHCLNNTFNQNPIMIGWNQESDQIFVFDNYKTTLIQFYALNINQDIKTKTISDMAGFINPISMSLSNDRNTIGFAYETPHQAPEAYISKMDTFKPKKLSNLQQDSNKKLGNMTELHWESTDGKDIEGLLITPPDYKSGETYPMVVAIHGGPTGLWTKRYLGGCWGYGDMIIPICWSDLTSKGYVVFQPNPRGSGGYGASFRLANYGDFGGKDYEDIIAGVDMLIEKGIADPDRLALFGWSYGGYMTAWAVTQTNRFKAAVAGASLTDLISFSVTTDIPDYLIQFLGNTFWEDPQLYLTKSPIMHSANIETPLLLIHGGNDERVPASQAQEFYRALKLQDKKTKLILLPNQGHAPTDPNLIESSIMEMEAWLSSALKN